ncbi:hypothetical protein C3374_00830 [Pantoea sp. PSNIH4]|nr:hypothetical protein C3374_00830 [Pantoea sp. PSNIH4]POY65706.1 hypothetical protein C3402_22135 [Pantoea sp. PSNIH3]
MATCSVLGKKEKIGYGLGDMASALVWQTATLFLAYFYTDVGNDSNLLIVFYVQIMPDDFVMQLHRF